MDEQDYLALLGNLRDFARTRGGKDILWYILSLSDLNISAFNKDPSTMSFMLGRQDVGLQIIRFLEDADPTIYPRLILDKLEIGGENG